MWLIKNKKVFIPMDKQMLCDRVYSPALSKTLYYLSKLPTTKSKSMCSLKVNYPNFLVLKSFNTKIYLTDAQKKRESNYCHHVRLFDTLFKAGFQQRSLIMHS